jgi:hypothetical protein
VSTMIDTAQLEPKVGNDLACVGAASTMAFVPCRSLYTMTRWICLFALLWLGR